MDSKEKSKEQLKAELSEKQKQQLITLGQKLKELRIKSGYSSYETFAFDKGINRANYGRYEKGENMRVSTLIQILDAHGLTLEDLFKK
ncbi:helix-turn-helix transcriptional regulator [Fluviicola sp.]|uniref:helix-turn-helix transcriptional regulator n=1 Tax=Fluviicola sp. TaxID=1917219 RepID=UPI0031E2405B